MPLVDYLDPNDRGGAQVNILKELGNRSGGICLMLSINWALLCIENDAPAPNVVFRNMKAKHLIWFKQVANNQNAYAADKMIRESNSPDASIEKYLRLSSKNVHHTIVGSGDVYKFRDGGSARMSACINAALQNSTVTPPVSIVVFYLKGGGHAVGAALSDDKVYIYDPNFGVFKAERQPDQLPDLIQNLSRAYGIKFGSALPVL